MRLSFLILSVVLIAVTADVVVAAVADDVVVDDIEPLPLAEPCDEEKCRPPSCRCSSVDIPKGLDPRNTPQFVLLTFDNAVNVININTYRNLLYGRTNSNQCKAGVTFYINHEYTDYTLVNELYNQGYEIALKSITYQTSQEYWRDASYDTLMLEFADQRKQMTHFANISESDIHGIRSPFRQLAGNETFRMLVSAGFRYDSSWTTIVHTNPGLWPYTMDYESIQDCVSPPCPTASIPGIWEIPMISWFDLNNTPCAVASSCFMPPQYDDEEGWLRFITANFERQYLGNRAPFGFFLNEWFIRSYPSVQNAFIRFLDLINNLNDVFMVSSNELIDWMENPVSVDEYMKKDCKTAPEAVCEPSSCGPLSANHTELLYYMQVCNRCPEVYPWIGNPFGVSN